VNLHEASFVGEECLHDVGIEMGSPHEVVLPIVPLLRKH
jgi:hypothetical protein